MDGRSTIPSETRQAGIVIRSPQATVSLEDRLTTQEVRMTKYSNITGPGRRNFEMFASLTTEPSERQRLYPRLYEGNDRRGICEYQEAGGRVLERVPRERHTPKLETRETGL
ncbi:hypothetical protein Sjap_016705 [Stephania japonica]|uniref:Uncharacterized protein n=1 Tax=Stephania japonica TaxID=461633 RepID=A0AAP0NSN1_9MAGN